MSKCTFHYGVQKQWSPVGSINGVDSLMNQSYTSTFDLSRIQFQHLPRCAYLVKQFNSLNICHWKVIRAKGAKTFFQNTNNTQRWIFELKLSLPESFIRGLKVSEWDCGGWLYSLAGSVGQSDVDFNNNNSNNNNIDDEDNCCLSNPALDITSYTQPWNTFSPLFAGLLSLSLSLSLSLPFPLQWRSVVHSTCCLRQKADKTKNHFWPEF